jgi:hypothetical protein
MKMQIRSAGAMKNHCEVSLERETFSILKSLILVS